MTVPTYPGTSRVIPLRSLQLSRVPSRYSFPLFFLHAIFQGIFQAPLFQVLGAALPGQVFTIANLTVTVEIALCILCILGIKKVMGKRSRYLIGG